MPALAEALKKTTKLTSLDISRNNMKAVQVEILAPALQNMGELASLNLANNELVSESSNIDEQTALEEGDMIEYQGVMCPISADFGSGYRVHMMHGIIALSNAIQDMRALASLNLENTYLQAEGTKCITGVLPEW